MEKLLKRSLSDKWVAGICAGLGKYFGVDPIVWRLIFIFGTIFTIIPFPLSYLILWVVVPKEEV